MLYLYLNMNLINILKYFNIFRDCLSMAKLKSLRYSIYNNFHWPVLRLLFQNDFYRHWALLNRELNFQLFALIFMVDGEPELPPLFVLQDLVVNNFHWLVLRLLFCPYNIARMISTGFCEMLSHVYTSTVCLISL